MRAGWVKFRAALEPMLGFRSQPPLALFTAWFTYFIVSQYFIGSSFIYRAGFYVTVLVFVALWVRQPQQVRAIPRHVGTRALAALALFVAFHALVISHGVEASKTLRDLATNSAFVLMCLVMFRQDEARWDRFLQLLLAVMAVCAVISLVRFGWLAELAPARLEPIGRHTNPILGANMYGVALMLALAMHVRPRPQPRWVRAAALALILLVPVLTALTQSRGPMLAQGVGLLLALILFQRYRLLAGLLLGAGLAAAMLLYAHANPGALPPLDPLVTKTESLLLARDSMRLQIWQYTWGLIAQQPWTGYGLRDVFTMPSAPIVVNPHNLFLSAAYYTGLPGLALLLAPLLAAFIYAWRAHSWYGRLCLLLLVHAVVALMTDGGPAIKSPAPLWTLYWMPIAMALARPQNVSTGQA